MRTGERVYQQVSRITIRSACETAGGKSSKPYCGPCARSPTALFSGHVNLEQRKTQAWASPSIRCASGFLPPCCISNCLFVTLSPDWQGKLATSTVTRAAVNTFVAMGDGQVELEGMSDRFALVSCATCLAITGGSAECLQRWSRRDDPRRLLATDSSRTVAEWRQRYALPPYHWRSAHRALQAVCLRFLSTFD